MGILERSGSTMQVIEHPNLNITFWDEDTRALDILGWRAKTLHVLGQHAAMLHALRGQPIYIAWLSRSCMHVV